MYKIIFHVPPSHVETVKNAMFDAGAGKCGHYSRCAWQVLGEGQFMPLPGSRPFIGKINTLAQVPEYYVEIIAEAEDLDAVVEALRNAHPYEEPSYQVIEFV